jgi:hypothetical protein
MLKGTCLLVIAVIFSLCCPPVSATTEDITIMNCNLLFQNGDFKGKYIECVTIACDGHVPVITESGSNAVKVTVDSKFSEKVKYVTKRLIIAAGMAVAGGVAAVVAAAATSDGLTISVSAGIFTATTVSLFTLATFELCLEMVADKVVDEHCVIS